MAEIRNKTSNTLLSGTKGDDFILNGGYDSRENSKSYGWQGSGGSNVTINADNGNDYVVNGGDYATINCGKGNDEINNDGANSKINGGDGNDTIWNYVYNNYVFHAENVTIDGGNGDDHIGNNGENALINGGIGDDFIGNYVKNITIIGGEGNDHILSQNNNVTINGGSGNDYIVLASMEDTLIKNTLIEYCSNDGNDYVEGFNKYCTLSISSGSYSTTKSGSDIIVTVDDGKISLMGAASLSAVNIDSTEEETPKNSWTLDGTTAKYGNFITIKGVKSLDGIFFTGTTTFTIAKASLGTNKVTISNGYTLALADDVSESTTKNSWSLSGTTATYKQTTTAGYSIANNVITYTKKATKTLATVKGVKSTKGLSVSGKVVTVSKSALNAKKVTISDGYTLKLGSNVSKSTTKTAWSLSGTTATYKKTTTAGYSLEDNEIIYTKKATSNFATVKGVKSTKGLSVSGKVVTVSKSALNAKKVTISDGYTLKLGSDVSESTTKTAWSLSNSTATYKKTTTAGYSLEDNEIIYTKKVTATLATVKGVKSTKGLSVSGEKITLKNSALKSKVTVSGDYEFDFASDYKNAAITGSKNSDTITARGKNTTINGGAGNDILTGGDGNIFVYNNGDGNDIITNYDEADKIRIESGTAEIITNGNDVIFNVGKGKITVQDGNGKNITYVDESGEENVYPDASDDVNYNDDGTGARLTATYEDDKFTPNEYSNYKNKLVTIDASEVTNPLTITGNKKMNVIIGSGDDDYISGELGADTIKGGNGNDTLVGGAGNDCLSGGKGDDSLWGGAGTDTLIGGDGSDIFVYQEGDGTIIIDDYTALDKIRVLSGDVGTPFADTTGNVTFDIGDGQIVVRGGSDKFIPIYDKGKNILVKYNSN